MYELEYLIVYPVKGMLHTLKKFVSNIKSLRRDALELYDVDVSLRSWKWVNNVTFNRMDELTYLNTIYIYIPIFLYFYLCRFYFVGDEDLLEIIGNSKNVGRLQKHIKKMFAGVHSLILEDEDQLVTGIASKEGEEVGKSEKMADYCYHKSIKISRE